MLLCILSANAQDDFVLRGLSVYGGDNEENLPVIVRGALSQTRQNSGSREITIQFDALAPHPPFLKIRFYHCNRDWQVDENLFVNDESRNTSGILSFVVSPNGVQTYSYRYVNSFPDGDFVRLEYGGNWIFRIMDKSLTTVYAEGRFFVVDNEVSTRVVVKNEYLTANSFPYNQIHKVITRASLRAIDLHYYTTVDVYQNRRIHNPLRIDVWDRDPYTKVEGFTDDERSFSVSNVLPGNEYRTLDLSNATRYPNYQPAKNVDGVDLMRQFWQTGSDRNGEATLKRFTGLSSEYLEYLFRLDLTPTDFRAMTSGGREIFVVGEFNFWNPTEEDKLEYDDVERSLVVKKLLRRGIYDYQYITGKWNAKTQRVEQQDWLAIEGTDVRTTNMYTVFVYYNDPRFGGFDRIVGVGEGRSSGTAAVGSN